MSNLPQKIAALDEMGCFDARDIVCAGMLAPQEMQGVSMAQIGLLVFFWSFSKLFDWLSCRICPGYRQNSDTKRKNTQTYVLELVITSALLLYIIFTVPRIITLERAGVEPFSPSEVKSAGYCINIIVMLYVFELIYRNEMNGWLALHHAVTILWGSLASVMFYETLDQVGFRGFLTLKAESDAEATDWQGLAPFFLTTLLSAVTEQFSFLALAMHRFRVRTGTRTMFAVASISSYLTKTTVFILTWIYYDQALLHSRIPIVNRRGSSFDWVLFWKIAVPVSNTLLIVAQVRCSLTPLPHPHDMPPICVLASF